MSPTKPPAAAAAKKKKKPKPDGDAAVLAAIATMPAPFRAMGKRLHALIRTSAPTLEPTTYYGMPWYAKDGTRVCFFRADKYLTFGLTEEAILAREPGAPHQLIASAWYLAALDDATEAAIAAIVRAAAGVSASSP